MVNDALVYDARLSGSDSTLWSTNITSTITTQLSNQIFAPGSTLGGVVSNNGLMFDCFTAAHGTELCTTDGSANGTSLLNDAAPGVTSSNLVAAVSLGDHWLLLASGYDGTTTHGVSLWSTDGIELSLRYNPWPGISNSSQAGSYGGLLVTSTQVFFIAHDGATGHEWHRWSHGELSDDWVVLKGQ
jgi:ELWxxDGT repeat protein